ncbi:hypothetical protein BGZ88_009643 [Linnemannia elongata]|nr:hypothetical protein BGZ88_009643 [Linnemannia elongata]
MQNNPLHYTPSGTVEGAQMISWTVDTKQPFPIQGPFCDLAGYLFKPTLKRLSPNEPLDLEIELMSSVSAESPLRVGVNVETMAPLDEKSLTHSNQHRNASLSDRNRTIEVKTVMTHDRWQASKRLRVELKFDPFQRQRPRYDWLWNSSSTKDVEIQFSDPQVAPILVHKDLILEACPKFVNLVKVVNPHSNAAGGDGARVGAMAQGQGPTPSLARPSRPGSPTPTTSPVMDDSSDASSFYRPLAGSFVNISRDPSVCSSSRDDMSVADSDRSHGSPKRSEDTSLKETYADERKPLLLVRGGKGDLDSDQHQKTCKQPKRNEKKQDTAAAASDPTSPTDVTQVRTDDDQGDRKVNLFAQEQKAKRLACQQEREKNPHSPLTHITSGLKKPSPPGHQQHQTPHLQFQQQSITGNNSASVSVNRRPERETWRWQAQRHPEVCAIIIRWIYFEELPTHISGSNYPLNVINAFLDTFLHLDLPLLFQSFLTTQLSLIEKNPNPMSLWHSAELAQQGGMVNRFFRPVIVKASSKNLRTIVLSREFGEVLREVDPSGIFREALAGQPSPLARE